MPELLDEQLCVTVCTAPHTGEVCVWEDILQMFSYMFGSSLFLSSSRTDWQVFQDIGSSLAILLLGTKGNKI